MERSEILAAMGGLKLFGMKAAALALPGRQRRPGGTRSSPRR